MFFLFWECTKWNHHSFVEMLSSLISLLFTLSPSFIASFLCFQILDMNMVRDLYTPVIPQVILCSLAGRKIYAFFIGNSSRSQSSSAHQGQIRRQFIWVGVNAVAYLCTFVHNSNKAQAVFSPQRFEAYQFAAQQKIQLYVFLFPPLCRRFHPFMAVQAERNQSGCSMWTPHQFGKPWKDQNLCH